MRDLKLQQQQQQQFIVIKAEYYSYLQVVKLINELKGVLTS